MPTPPKVLKVEREARFEAARQALLSDLQQGRREDGWFRAPGVVGLRHGRDVEVRFPGGPDARSLIAQTRIRRGHAFVARPRPRLLRLLGAHYLSFRGAGASADLRFRVERILRDYGALRVAGGQGLVQATLIWEPAAPDPARVLKVLDRLHRIALTLEEVHDPLLESGGNLQCPFCREFIGEAQALARCELCTTPYHPACFEENQGCAIYGCRNRVARSSSGRLPSPKASGKDES